MLLAMPAWAQQTTTDEAITNYESATHQFFQGIPTDWSSNHVVFSKPAPGSDAEDAVQKDPRYWQQQIRRSQAVTDEVSAYDSSDALTDISGKKNKKSKKSKKNNKGGITSDWSIYLGSGATVGADNFPAKFSTSTGAGNCAGTASPDYVVYNTSLGGAVATAAAGSAEVATSAAGDTLTVGGTAYHLESTLAGATLNQILDAGATTPNHVLTAQNIEAAINNNSTECGSAVPCFRNVAAANTSAFATWTGGASNSTVNLTATPPGVGGTGTGTGNNTTLSQTGGDITLTAFAGGADGQASITAFDNLYGTTCASDGAIPTSYWSYNTTTGSKIVTAPILSTDGTQVAFAQSTSGGVASLVLLKWAPNAAAHSVTGGATTNAGTTVTAGTNGGTFSASDVGALVSGTNIPKGAIVTAVTNSTTATISQAATATTSGKAVGFGITAPSVVNPGTIPIAATAAAYNTCTAPCMFSIPFSGGANDTNSSPYYDYSPGSDTLYVGDNNGRLHKFNPVFAGAPAEAGSPWPAVILTGSTLTSPLLDLGTGNVFVGTGGATGTISYVNEATPGTVISTATLDTGEGFTDGPIVDSSAGSLYAFSPQHGVYQLSTGFSSGATPTATAVGTGSTTIPVYAGTFDNAYFTNAAPTGNIFVCGDPGGGPRVYQIPITSNVMAGTSTAGPIVSAVTTTCSPATEVFNSPADWVFLSARTESATSLPSGCTNGIGCLTSYDVHTGAAVFSHASPQAGGTSGISIDNVSSTTGNSQIYFSTLANGTAKCATSSNTGDGGCAIQAAQSTLGQ
ncbi:MAG: hypothetical protein ABSD30_05395 [Candidatus Binatus sp.]